MARQLTFDLPVRESRERGDFFVSEANALAVARLDDPGTWPNRKLVLVGPEGAGKSHLAQVWAEQHDGMPMRMDGLHAAEIPEIAQPVALDVQDHLGRAVPEAEEALFHLHNHMQSSQLPLLLIARRPPAQWDIALPDLKSRMEATDLVRIDMPDDALLSAVMVKLFADRQIAVAPPVIGWLVTHMDRSFADALRVVEALDKAALSEGRAITRALAQRILADINED